MGNTTFNNTLSCDSVIDGAFFPQPDFQVPEEKMSKHARENVVMPTPELANLIVVHSQLAFCLLEALLDGPTKAAEPDKNLQPGAE